MELPVKPLRTETADFSAFERAKLDFLDAFFELDLQVSAWLASLDGEPAEQSSAAVRLTALAGHPGFAARAASKQGERVRHLLNESARVAGLRDDLVNSRAVMGTVAGKPTAFLTTAALARIDPAAFVPVPVHRITRAAIGARNLARTLKLWLAQPDEREA